MADISSSHRTQRSVPIVAGEASTDLVELIELIYFAYRDWTAEPDAMLEVYGLGRAHHRVLHFVHRKPGLRVTDLLEPLKITKQSLNRVLKPLYADGWLEARAGRDDRRERNLFLTPKGQDLAERLLALQTARLAVILRAAGAKTDQSSQAVAFLKAMQSST
jgi:DNA-binding MarR family transcriptional regulator